MEFNGLTTRSVLSTGIVFRPRIRGAEQNSTTWEIGRSIY